MSSAADSYQFSLRNLAALIPASSAIMVCDSAIASLREQLRFAARNQRAAIDQDLSELLSFKRSLLSDEVETR